VAQWPPVECLRVCQRTPWWSCLVMLCCKVAIVLAAAVFEGALSPRSLRYHLIPALQRARPVSTSAFCISLLTAFMFGFRCDGRRPVVCAAKCAVCVLLHRHSAINHHLQLISRYSLYSVAWPIAHALDPTPVHHTHAVYTHLVTSNL